MHRTALASALALAGCAITPCAFAQISVGGGYTNLDVATSTGDSIDIGAITGRVGLDLNSFLALEGEASVGVVDGTLDLFLGSRDFGLDYQLGVFAVGRLPIPMFGTLFARGGYAQTKIDDEFNFINDGSGFAWGGGVEFDVLPFVKGRIDYTEFENTGIKSFGASAVVKF